MIQAIANSAQAFKTFRKTSRYVRSQLLALMASQIEKRSSEFVEFIVTEAKKPITLAEAEVRRAIATFTIASEEAKRFGGEVVPIDIDQASQKYRPAVVYWVPRGPVFAITPFNFPLNLVAHKVAPALAIGASVILKPPPQAPGASLLLEKIFNEVITDEIPKKAFQVVPCSNEVASLGVTDPRMAILSFTGSPAVGWMLQAKAVGKKVCLELGGNAAVIVHKDADLARAALRCSYGAFAYAGQVCISVQRIYVQEEVFEKFKELFLKEVGTTSVGDPSKKETLVGPVIDQKSADRIMAWIKEAENQGAKILMGGQVKGEIIQPTVLINVKIDSKISSEEVFGPVVILEKYKDFDDAVKTVNASRFGLQAGVFTDSSRCIQSAIADLDVGGIMINEVPTYRADNMPYGGMKESGLGREGVRYAMEEFSERKVVVSYT